MYQACGCLQLTKEWLCKLSFWVRHRGIRLLFARLSTFGSFTIYSGRNCNKLGAQCHGDQQCQLFVSVCIVYSNLDSNPAETRSSWTYSYGLLKRCFQKSTKDNHSTRSSFASFSVWKDGGISWELRKIGTGIPCTSKVIRMSILDWLSSTLFDQFFNAVNQYLNQD